MIELRAHSSRRFPRRVYLAVACYGVLLTAGVDNPSRAQLPPIADQVIVNSYTTSPQFFASVAVQDDDGYLVVWTSDGQDSGTAGIYAQRFGSDGGRLGAEFVVSDYSSSAQVSPALTRTASGTFVAVWSSVDQDGSELGIFGRRLSSSGTRLASELQINSTTALSQSSPAVAPFPAGGFIIAWRSSSAGAAERDIVARRFDEAGLGLGGEIPVNQFTTGRQRRPDVAVDIDGTFVVVWASEGQDGSGYGVFTRRFDSVGAAIGSEMRVNVFTLDDQTDPGIAADANGNFVIVWTDTQLDASGDIFGRRWAASGAPVGAPFLVNTYTTGGDGFASVAMASDGRFVVSWNDSAELNFADTTVFGQRYDSSGNRLGTAFQVSDPALVGAFPATVMDRDGDLVASWHSFDGGEPADVAARRFLGEVPGLDQPSDLSNPSASDPDVPAFVADDFLLQEDGLLNQLSFCGGYSPDDTPFPDDFTIRVLFDDGGLPGAQYANLPTGGVERTATGRADALDEYCYELTVTSIIPLDAGRYWLEISNDSTGSSQTWAWLGGAQDGISGKPASAASNDGSSWSGGGTDRALTVPYATFATPGATFFFAEAIWSQSVGSRERFDTTAENVALADEVVAVPGQNELLGTDVLTFDSSNTSLSRSFTLTQLETNKLGWTFDDGKLPSSRYELSPNDANNGEDDDFEILLTDGPPLTAFGMILVEEAGNPNLGVQSLSVYGAGDQLIASLDLARISFHRAWTFVGVTTDQTITRVLLDEDSGADDIGVQHFRFGVNAAPIFADGFESGDTSSWSTTNP